MLSLHKHRGTLLSYREATSPQRVSRKSMEIRFRKSVPHRHDRNCENIPLSLGATESKDENCLSLTCPKTVTGNDAIAMTKKKRLRDTQAMLSSED